MAKSIRRVTIRLRPREHEALECITEATGMTISETLRSLISVVGALVHDGSVVRTISEDEVRDMFQRLADSEQQPQFTAVPKYNHNRRSNEELP